MEKKKYVSPAMEIVEITEKGALLNMGSPGGTNPDVGDEMP